MEKEEKKLSDGFKVATIVLALFLAGSLFYIYKISDDATKTERRLKSDKEELSEELETMLEDLKKAQAKSENLDQELQDRIAEIEQLQADLDQANDDKDSLKHFRNEAYRLRKANKKLLAQVGVLKDENNRLSIEIDSTSSALSSAQQMNDTLSLKLNTTLEEASKLVVVNTKAISYKVKKSGKESPTDKASKANRITVCYNVPQNNVAQEQEKTFYIQIIDSRNNVLGQKKTQEFGEQSLTYSAISTLNYRNKSINVCESINSKEGFPKGKYAVNIYDASELISSSTLTLR